MPSLRTFALAAVPALLLGGLSAPTVAAPTHAAGKADVAVTLHLSNGGEAADGKITSDRKSCVQERSVVALGQANDTGEIIGGNSYVSDNQGRWSTAMAARRGTAYSIFVVVPGSAKCDVAQSQRRPISPRAGGPANVKVTFNIGMTALRGKVTSPDKSCVKRVPVVFLVKNGTPQWEYSEVFVKTDKHGKYEYTGGGRLARARGLGSAIAVVPASRGCDVAQSPARSLSA